MFCCASRLAWPDGTTIFEVGPYTGPRLKVLRCPLGAQSCTDCHAITIDLRNNWPRVLQGSVFDLASTSLWQRLACRAG
ncbi:hypothetical protein DIJ64_13970 [Mycobacterium leprae]|uniref:Uncharacterized protein n=1 Tax=Mycobacterium leprae TaxID=1769 RepID=A0AAD0KVV1_MYCLR|nr:hypothetical protein DIJ64_13970 [Mycobacterium leprae]